MGEVQEIRPAEEPFVDAEIVAKHFKVSPAHIRHMARAGYIPGQRCGFGPRKFWRFKMSQVVQAYAEAS